MIGTHAGMPKAGAAIGAAIGAGGNKVASLYGNQVTAAGADMLAGVLSKSPILQEAVSNNPAIAPAILNAIMDKDIKLPDNAISRRMLAGSKAKSK
jgi:hypothetical protein